MLYRLSLLSPQSREHGYLVLLLICTILFCSSDMDNERYSCFPHTRYSFQVIDFEETNFDMHITSLLFAFFPLLNSLAPVDLMNNICDIPY